MSQTFRNLRRNERDDRNVYTGLHDYVLVILADFNKTLFSTDFLKILRYQIS